MISRNPSLSQLRTEFNDMSTTARVSLIAGVAAELAAKVGAWVDLYRRPASKVRGPKWAWALAQFINGIGPAAYWSVGRK
ncbi:PLDc N-terminal domain-containing protein [Corynebacterium sp.]|uniref:PLDc N-terminal domain-containing protein n=1 Tax=Corynebacterium sp. TaxID=1720 RepID=UPI0026DF1BEB|nr:PLDc N-terminal domain-containing protein [Corynebacterium sp.]MDO5511108.1 PLDc N-terminal domain-containing protein [Corynebacterium sp.]